FLSSIRQRFKLPGGSCCFDLPALHYWLHLPIERKKRDAQQWQASLKPLSDALSLWLKLTRETGHFKAQIGRAGFFQSDADEANILRLHIPMEYGVYPMISGHKNRFAIKFMSFENGQACTQ
ncbi:cell division protein ZapD, partial [Vibrio parahaemolyticus]|uniref:cell division protein ZapD n=1 Tax=Vibrio parahaemolyticus TaxID=670 RepID=UPI00146BEBBE